MTQPPPPNFYAGSTIDADDLQGIAGGPGRTAYIPTLTNISIGNGTRAGWYRWLNSGLILIVVRIRIGSTTTISGTIEISLPSGVTLDTTIPQLGNTTALDSVSFQRYSGVAIMGATTFQRLVYQPTGQVGANATYPFSWADTDWFAASVLGHTV
ncbi:hypothetical protein [Parafrankia sp. EUN1f]|uniref:hypothetical protein n=1 Tax=Parafrankia sp. EUN1f TaxID=102897 RepID=UPI0001C452AB|nr:hypothetical protein [Parafrankia sp. EUN1f]EFC79078.1 hypothetical protein FrEUN1fDRAFT_7803 [Parafrankia sp. EUN1f]